MPYLIRTHNNQLLVLNHSTKFGLYSQTLSSNGPSRPVIIHRGSSFGYSATIDHDQNLHIITQPSKDQIIHLHYKDSNISRNIILEDPKGIYDFSNLHTIASKEHLHLFYTANQPIGDSFELIHHILCQESENETCPILSFSSKPLGFSYLAHNNGIFLLYGEIGQQYTLNLMIYKENKWSDPIPVASSTFPIEDFQFCITHQGHIHVLYVQEKYGRYNLIYKKSQQNVWSDDQSLYTSSSPINPCIFTYHSGLWINFVDDELQMILSMDDGNTFSKNVNCSMHMSDLNLCHFVSAPNILPSSFEANMLYASLSHPIRAGIIAAIDMINFHPDMKANTELELFLDGVFHSKSSQPSKPTVSTDQSADLINLQAEIQELSNSRDQTIRQYNEMVELTNKIQDEGKKWRDKALSLESQIEVYKTGDINYEKNQDL